MLLFKKKDLIAGYDTVSKLLNGSLSIKKISFN